MKIRFSTDVFLLSNGYLLAMNTTIQEDTSISNLLRIRSEYRLLLQSPPLSLRELLQPDGFSFEEFCKGFRPHRRGKELQELIMQFGKKNGIWFANSIEHVSCALFVYPSGTFDRMLPIMKNLTFGFYLNDVMGREYFQYLSPANQVSARQLIQQMTESSLDVPDSFLPLAKLNAAILREFKDHSPLDWFDRFHKIYSHHLSVTHMDGNAISQERMPEVTEYIEQRCHYAGVYHVLLLIEYSTGQFIDFHALEAFHIEQEVRRLSQLTAFFSATANDLFSFEKEVIDLESDCNLVPVILLNEPELSLQDALLKASDIVRTYLTEILSLIDSIQLSLQNILPRNPKLYFALTDHISGIIHCIQAGWMWHCHSHRYKRARSIWTETTG